VPNQSQARRVTKSSRGGSGSVVAVSARGPTFVARSVAARGVQNCVPGRCGGGSGGQNTRVLQSRVGRMPSRPNFAGPWACLPPRPLPALTRANLAAVNEKKLSYSAPGKVKRQPHDGGRHSRTRQPCSGGGPPRQALAPSPSTRIVANFLSRQRVPCHPIRVVRRCPPLPPFARPRTRQPLVYPQGPSRFSQNQIFEVRPYSTAEPSIAPSESYSFHKLVSIARIPRRPSTEVHSFSQARRNDPTICFSGRPRACLLVVFLPEDRANE